LKDISKTKVNNSTYNLDVITDENKAKNNAKWFILQ